jgi:hypothetical protein
MVWKRMMETMKMRTKGMKNGDSAMGKESILKIDRDCHVDHAWMLDQVSVINAVCRLKGVDVTKIEMAHTKKGLHFYVGIKPTVSAHLANRLQYLLGDDCRRVDYNRARIRSRYPDWNKLFERIGQRFVTLYRCNVPAGTRKTRKGGIGQVE